MRYLNEVKKASHHQYVIKYVVCEVLAFVMLVSKFMFLVRCYNLFGRFSTLTSCSGCSMTSGLSSDLPLLLCCIRIWSTSLAILLVSSRFKPNGKIFSFS